MEHPLSVAAAVVGLLGAGARLSSSLVNFVSHAQNAPSLARVALQEVGDLTTVFSHLQTYALGETQAYAERGSLILLDQVLTTLTGCVTTYSDLQLLLDGLKTGDGMRMNDKLKWAREQPKVLTFIQRLQNHKSSLSLMLSILQCNSLKEAQASTAQLYDLIEHALHSNQALATRLSRLESKDSSHFDTASRLESKTEERPMCSIDENAESAPSNDNWSYLVEHPFERDLQNSPVYNKTLKRHSISSVTSSAIHGAALSVFSNLSLSQVSCISFHALPIYATDLSNADQYVFGEQGAAKFVRIDKRSSRTGGLRRHGSRSYIREPVSIENLQSVEIFARNVRADGRSVQPKVNKIETATMQYEALLAEHSNEPTTVLTSDPTLPSSQEREKLNNHTAPKRPSPEEEMEALRGEIKQHLGLGIIPGVDY